MNEAPATQGSGQVLFMLPGAQMTAEHMVQEGLLTLAREHRPALTVIPLSLRQQGVFDESALRSLETDVLSPARERYQAVWLGGISMGGLLSLAYMASRLGRVDGLCLLAPYPGSRLTLNAIDNAGGLDAWRPTAAQLEDPEFRIWHWLNTTIPELPVFIGHGEQDRFASGIQRVARCLHGAQTAQVPGGHDWDAWRALWTRFLHGGLLKD